MEAERQIAAGLAAELQAMQEALHVALAQAAAAKLAQCLRFPGKLLVNATLLILWRVVMVSQKVVW